MTATAHATSAWATARRAYTTMATLLFVVVAVAVGVTYLLTRSSSPSAGSGFSPLHSISDTCTMTRPGQPC